MLSYRDEYKEALGDSRGNFHVLTAHEWLTNQLESNALQSAVKNIAKSDRTFDLLVNQLAKLPDVLGIK